MATVKGLGKVSPNGYNLGPICGRVRDMTPVEKDSARGLNGALATEIRAQQGMRRMSTAKLALASGIERGTLTRYLEAKRPLNTAHVEAIAEAIGMDPGELMALAVRRRDEQPDLYYSQTDSPYAVQADAARDEDA
jgi:transcriptional regulator with XRE-family HTH domain